MKPTAFCLSFVAFTVALGIAIPLQAQKPPSGPGNQFSAQFLGGADQETLLSLFEGTAPDHPRLSLERGNLSYDYTNSRLSVDFMDLDGTSQKTYVILYSKNLGYTLDLVHKTCQVVTLTPGTEMQQLFTWLPNATLAQSKQAVLPDNPSFGNGVVTLQTWEYRPSNDGGFKQMGATFVEGAGTTPISAFWQLAHQRFPIEVDFETFSNSVNSAAFNVPDYCNN